MASQSELDELPPPTRRRFGCWALLAGLLLLVAVALGIAWLNRETLADDFIADELARRGIDATYEIDRIGGRRQVLRNIVVGDPRRPDLTVERAEVRLAYRFGYPRVTSVRLVRPRLFGTYVDGKLSFGELDPLLFTGEEGPFEFPDLELAVVDGRGVIEGDYGPVALKIDGQGHLQGGFAGELAAIAPRLGLPGCEPVRTTLYGRVAIDDARPQFEGPLRFGRIACAEQGLALAGGSVQLDGRADAALDGFEGEAGLDLRSVAFADAGLARLEGTTRFTWRGGGLTARYDLTGAGLAAPQAAVASLGLEGWLRARRNFERIEVDTDVEGRGVRLGTGLDSALADAADATEGTLLGPILERVRGQLAREGRNSRLAAELTVRRTGARTSIVVPEGVVRGASGETLLALSRFQLAYGAGPAPRISGNFSTGGEGLPRIVGQMERRADGAMQARLRMAEYRAGASRLAVPELVLIQRPDGALGFSGDVLASGALPGGEAEALRLPVSGNWSPSRGLALWNDCTELRFERLQLANLRLERNRLNLCPARGSAIVRYDGRGLRLAAGTPSLALTGRLGETPIALRSGAVGFAYPGTISAQQVLVTLGPPGTATTFAIRDLTAQAGTDIAGRFGGTDVRLYAVPLDLVGASGNWRYANGRFSVTDGAFRLVDRQELPRFLPMSAEGATLALQDNQITAEALLREAAGGREITQVSIAHNLATGRGHADLAVAGVTFGDGFQPDALFPAAFGVVANVRGTVTGTGRIDWSEGGVTSRGRFSSNSLDFAAAFGPVRGASGTIEFTDLLGLTTAPNQRLRVASINPGIEVLDGEIGIELRGGEVLALTGGSWPFMGGTLTMRPVEIRFGAAEARRYVLEIVGLDAARFVDHMELENIAATGIFDGTVPLVFDESGNGRVEGGLLLSRPPGGNVAYIGQLTYEDLGTMANMAFQALRSLNYTQMAVEMNGDLTGEIITELDIDGVSQGEGAEQNIATRALAGLPIRFEVNIRAPFYQLIGSLRAMYDPAAIRDPRDLGLLDAQGNVIRRETDGVPAEPVTPEDLIPDEALIQRRESEDTP